ncbi:hypothetical protein HX878_11320 [Pseudomonas veronii]|uniref:hypothetical protein n=1 Tax=Pseudomonas veronii TaxID=76761 RepID=UPI0015A49B6F|nr:hypothetical protein [Pseudomonas veronii]NWD55344.1 hypothetical protein [Pseudomonas veronii]
MIHSPLLRPGVRYQAVNRRTGTPVDGHFLDGSYYIGAHEIGRLDGAAFLYFGGTARGGKIEPTFPDGIAGSLEGLTLTLADGVFDLEPITDDA